MTANVLERNNVRVTGDGATTMLLAHGFGCDQRMWDPVVERLQDDHRVALFDYVGAGRSDLSAWTEGRYSALDGFATDVIEVCDALELEAPVFVGHSVSGMIGLLASLRRPDLFSSLVMVCPSPCFFNDAPYAGGFERADLEELIDLLSRNHIGWANHLAPLVAGPDADGSVVTSLSDSFCATDPLAARRFAEATFFSDQRPVLAEVGVPSLILQSTVDQLAPVGVGRYMHAQMPGSMITEVTATGHALHMTHPDETVAAIRQFLRIAA